MINKIVLIQTPYSKTIEHVKVENVIIIMTPKEASTMIANIDCEDVACDNGEVIEHIYEWDGKLNGNIMY